MSDTETVPVTENPVTAVVKKAKSPKKPADAPKGKRGPKPKGDKKVPPHPPTATLVNEAIEKLNEKGGSSLRAIKKYIADVHKLDADRLGPFIRKYLKNAVEKGILIQPKGKGTIGSFKLAKKSKVPAEKPKKPRAKKEKTPGALKMKKTKTKKPKSPKKIAASIKKSADKVKASVPTTPHKVAKPKPLKKPAAVKKPVSASKKPTVLKAKSPMSKVVGKGKAPKKTAVAKK